LLLQKVGTLAAVVGAQYWLPIFDVVRHIGGFDRESTDPQMEEVQRLYNPFSGIEWDKVFKQGTRVILVLTKSDMVRADLVRMGVKMTKEQAQQLSVSARKCGVCMCMYVCGNV
jgi:hypothetical protein